MILYHGITNEEFERRLDIARKNKLVKVYFTLCGDNSYGWELRLPGSPLLSNQNEYMDVADFHTFNEMINTFKLHGIEREWVKIKYTFFANAKELLNGATFKDYIKRMHAARKSYHP